MNTPLCILNRMVGLKSVIMMGMGESLLFLHTYDSFQYSALENLVHNSQNACGVSEYVVEAWAINPAKWHQWKKTLDEGIHQENDAVHLYAMSNWIKFAR